MSRRGRGLVVLSALCALSGVFGAASAQAGALFPDQVLNSPSNVLAANPLTPLPAPGAFKITGSNGYSLFVVGAPAHKDRPASVVIFATDRRGGAVYDVPATVTKTSMQAKFGALGEVAVTFHPSGKAKKVKPSCGGRSVAFDSGSYEGTIRFKGEEGFTSVEATDAKGDLGFLIDLLCAGNAGGGSGHSAPGAELNAYTGKSRQGARLNVVKTSPTAPAHFEAGVSEVREGVSISRFVEVIEPARTFAFDSKVQTATLRPPAPFSGAGRFRRAAAPANRWSGNLTVDLPGRAGVKLTGSGDRANLRRAY